ncbi:DUF4238 domain-containing protein [Leptospira ognonensis]|uniref:DUF4238 domain-containing protein n=1 Tax=Leptospira ognonensis TaxID=2484945 RepID=A0A4R9K5N2_9LEPT|nr:DUF4238 domain-containing protein [Leptospira ognonensis]TGL61538.1 DUF4238 domain-containing protein [Leptospira ognonensis]
MKNITKWQHIVPRFYLKEFKNEKNLIEIYDIIKKKFNPPKGTKPLCAEYFYYAAETGIQDTISQEVEAFFQNYETPISNFIPFIKEIVLGNSEITFDEKYILSLLMSMLYLRNNKTRSHIKHLTSDISSKTLKGILNVKGKDRFFSDYERDTGIIIDQKERDEFLLNLEKDFFKIEVDNIPHIEFLSKIPNFANLLCSQNWIIYISRIDENFITSDTPIISKNLENWDTQFGVPALAKSYFFSLTPKIFIRTYYDTQNTKKATKRKNLYNLSDAKIVKELNTIIAINSEKLLFGRKQLDLKKVLT